MKAFHKINDAKVSMPENSLYPMLRFTTQIVAAHIGHNETANDALPDLIKSVYRSLSSAIVAEPEQATDRPPAVPVKKSVFPDYLVCLEDGKKLKMLKRHLKASYNMTPAEYRAKWGLPVDYPMVAPNYAAKRSELAKVSGLGRKKSDEPKVTIGRARKAKGSRG